MEKGQCPTITTWEGVNIRSRKSTPTATTPGQVDNNDYEIKLILIESINIFCRHRFKAMVAQQKRTEGRAFYPLLGLT